MGKGVTISSISLMLSSSIILLFSLHRVTVNATVDKTFYHVMEEDQDLENWKDNGWKKLHRVHPHEPLELTFALKQKNTDALEKRLLEVSDPDSEHYGHYMTIDEITQIVSPTNHSVVAVTKWVNDMVPGTKCELNLNRDFLICLLHCSAAEKLLIGTAFSYFTHTRSPKLLARSDSRYHVPVHVAKHLDFVGGVHRLPAVKDTPEKEWVQPMTEMASEFDGWSKVIPKVLRAKYNMKPADVGSHPNNSQSVASFFDDPFSPADLSKFMSSLVGPEFVHRAKIDKIVDMIPGTTSTEANMDVQYLMSLGSNITTWFWYNGGYRVAQEPFLKWLVNLGNTYGIPWVHSVSYADKERSLSTAYMKRINTELVKVGLRGVTVLGASGDRGARCEGKLFNPNFPASSPYITAVGGTWFKSPKHGDPEYADGMSGGGFSNVFEQPKYQASKVEAYMKKTKLPPNTYYNKSGRAIPDIAASCKHIWIIKDLRTYVTGGTSAATPIVSGILSMLNEHRLRNGKPTMGFINPFLYKNAHALNDVVQGCNWGCTEGVKGFCAAKGYDVVTGNGVPDYQKLVKAAMGVFS